MLFILVIILLSNVSICGSYQFSRALTPPPPSNLHEQSKSTECKQKPNFDLLDATTIPIPTELIKKGPTLIFPSGYSITNQELQLLNNKLAQLTFEPRIINRDSANSTTTYCLVCTGFYLTDGSTKTLTKN